jgi:uracil-DNA glycosylase
MIRAIQVDEKSPIISRKKVFRRIANQDTPKSLRDPAAREARRRRLREKHVAPLAAYVERLRISTSKGKLIPYFDPLDGGTRARCLFVFEAPGPKAVQSGFISRNNPDESAKNMFNFSKKVGLARKLTASWNIVTWYVGERGRINPARAQEISEGRSHLLKVIRLFPRLRVVVMGGKKAEKAWDDLERSFPSLHLFAMPHPSPQFVNRGPGN